MQCNIDARGKAVRLIMGMIMAILGASLVTLHLSHMLTDQPGDWPLYGGVALLLMGGFGVFEGWAGWCVVRAMGFKTRL